VTIRHPALTAGGWVASVAVGLVYVVVLATPVVRLPSDRLGARRFQTPEITSGLRISQTFEMPAAGLHAVEFLAVAVGSASGDVRLEVHDLTGHGDVVVRSASVPAADLVRMHSYRFEFPPIASPSNTPYSLDLVSSDTHQAQGVALWATKGVRYAGGAMLINGVPRWADLAFKTYAPAPSRWRMLMSMPASRKYLAIGGFAANWIMLAVVFRALTVVTNDASTSENDDRCM
jgi:hypothetical protein